MKNLSLHTSFVIAAIALVVGCIGEGAVDDDQVALWGTENVDELMAMQHDLAAEANQDRVDEDASTTAPAPEPATEPAPEPTTEPIDENAGETGPDHDGDGVIAARDCDDNNSEVGRILYISSFDDQNESFFQSTPELAGTPWSIANSFLSTTDGGRQAALGADQSWRDIVVYALVSANHTVSKCSAEDAPTNHWRFGVMARASLDRTQDEGFHGYSCAFGSDTDGSGGSPDMGASTGRFLQIGEFTDGREDEVDSTCSNVADPTFNVLGRSSYAGSAPGLGAFSLLKFTAIGADLSCELHMNGQVVTTSARDDSFVNGAAGLTTLNVVGGYEFVSVCEALAR